MGGVTPAKWAQAVRLMEADMVDDVIATYLAKHGRYPRFAWSRAVPNVSGRVDVQAGAGSVRPPGGPWTVYDTDAMNRRNPGGVH